MKYIYYKLKLMHSLSAYALFMYLSIQPVCENGNECADLMSSAHKGELGKQCIPRSDVDRDLHCLRDFSNNSKIRIYQTCLE